MQHPEYIKNSLIENWELGIGHWALGIGHWELGNPAGRHGVASGSSRKASMGIGY
jgi:hypothetical protein